MLELIPCCGHNRILLLDPADIETAYSDLSGVHLVTKDTKATTQLTLKLLEEKTPLIRCHRQYLIHPQAIREIKLLENGLAEITTQYGHQIPGQPAPPQRAQRQVRPELTAQCQRPTAGACHVPQLLIAIISPPPGKDK